MAFHRSDITKMSLGYYTPNLSIKYFLNFYENIDLEDKNLFYREFRNKNEIEDRKAKKKKKGKRSRKSSKWDY